MAGVDEDADVLTEAEGCTADMSDRVQSASKIISIKTNIQPKCVHPDTILRIGATQSFSVTTSHGHEGS